MFGKFIKLSLIWICFLFVLFKTSIADKFAAVQLQPIGAISTGSGALEIELGYVYGNAPSFMSLRLPKDALYLEKENVLVRIDVEELPKLIRILEAACSRAPVSCRTAVHSENSTLHQSWNRVTDFEEKSVEDWMGDLN